jgi:glutamate/tyrosine decarboxylase-like PLP-dependent enzyme
MPKPKVTRKNAGQIQVKLRENASPKASGRASSRTNTPGSRFQGGPRRASKGRAKDEPAPVAADDPSLTQGLSKCLASVLPALEDFLRYKDQDPAAAESARWHAELDQVLPQQGAGAEGTMRVLHEVAIPHGSRDGAPGFTGWVTTVSTVVPAVAGFSATIFGEQRTGLHSANFLESLALEWLKQLLGIPADYQGVFTSGGSVSLLIALGAARQFAGERAGIDSARDGIAAMKRPRLYASAEVHHSIGRAAAVLGLGREGTVQLPTDSRRRLDVRALRDRLRRDRRAGYTPVAVIATAGTVNTGAVDPIREMLEVCRDAEVWLVVDGAYGLFGALDPAVAPLFGGIGEADALVVDPHKWMAVPQGCGSVFVREREVLKRAFKMEPSPYLQTPLPEGEPVGSQADGRGMDFDGFTVELSARARGVTVWAALKEIGADGMRERVRRHNFFARHLAERVEASSVLELCAPVTLSICCFRYAPPELRGRRAKGALEQLNQLNREILIRLHNEHHHSPSSTELDGAFVIRACYLNPRTTLADVDGLADAVERIGSQVWREREPAKR